MWDDPIELIEHQSRPVPSSLTGRLKELETYLDTVWKSRTVFYDQDPERPVSQRQPFLRFELSQGKLFMRSGHYVGFIQFEGHTIQIIPKLFGRGQTDTAFNHLLWWLDYSQRVSFPFTDLFTDSSPIDDFPEALIRYFARFTHPLIESQPYHQYQETTETMSYLRGRLNTQEYINTSLSRGNWHQLVCDYEPFLFNNRLNQIIKYVVRRLVTLCKQADTRRDLERILFVLDEVEDLPCTVQDCDRVQLNRFFEGYDSCLGMCRFFLSHQYLNRQNAQERQFCFLVPMDVIYEDFIAGVIKTHFGGKYRIQTQATDWLTEQRVFQIRNDLFLTDKVTGAALVADTKYKVRKIEPGDPKAGISQTDLYQMVSYGLRRDTCQLVLLYPTPYGQEPALTQQFTVNSGLMSPEPIYIQAMDLTVTGSVSTRQAFNQQVIEGALVPQLTNIFNQFEHP